MSIIPERSFFKNVEELFSEFVEYFGGFVIEKLDDNDTSNLNADYLFEKPEIIGELKTFQKDIFSDLNDLPKLENLYEKWRKNRTITEKQFRNHVLRRAPLPEKCNFDILNSAGKTIERVIYKANKQIGQSKITLKKPEAKGIIFLINDGNYFFTNEGFLQVIANIVGRKFKESNFDVIIYLTVNQATFKEGSDLDYNFWVPIYTKVDDQGETIVSDELHAFINELGNKFLNDFLTSKTGLSPIGITEIQDLTDAQVEMKKHNFIPKEVIYNKKN